MKISVKCRHCLKVSQVEDMGDNCICPACNKFVISISEYIRKQIFGGDNGSNSMD